MTENPELSPPLVAGLKGIDSSQTLTVSTTRIFARDPKWNP